MKTVAAKYPGVELKKSKNGWEVIIPEKYKEGHEAHFGRVTEKFLEYLKNGNMPSWEVPNMIAKYYTTTKAGSIIEKISLHETVHIFIGWTILFYAYNTGIFLRHFPKARI